MDRDDSVFVQDTSEEGPLVLDGTTWSAHIDGEKTIFDFKSGRMLVMKRGGKDTVCTYALDTAAGTLVISETGAKAQKRQYAIASHSEVEIMLADEESGAMLTLYAGEDGDVDGGAAGELDLCLVGTQLPSGSKLLQE